MNDTTTNTWRSEAERIFNANLRRDYVLAQHLLRPYPVGTSRRQAIDAELAKLSTEHRVANPPAYFR